MPPERKGEAGFTLLEALVAFVILTLVVTACLQVYSRSAEAEAKAQWSDRANALLRDRLAAFETLGLSPGQSQSGSTGDGLSWTVATRQPDGALGGNRAIVWITATVSDPAGGAHTASTVRWRGEIVAEASP
jgi:type II secretory pathway pseudopilin PulG